MHVEIKGYAFFWHAGHNEGSLHLQLADGGSTKVHVDSAQEGTLLLDVLRNEKPVFFDPQNELIMTGMEPVGEGEDD